MILPLEENLFHDLLAALAEIPVALRNLLNRKEWLLIIIIWNLLESLQKVLSFLIMTWRLFFLLIHFIKSSIVLIIIIIVIIIIIIIIITVMIIIVV